MAVDLTSLGPHRLPVRRYEAFERTAATAEASVDVAETQSAVWIRAVSVAETASAADAQSASIVGEQAHGDYTSLGAHRLPTRRYGAFNHNVVHLVAEATSSSSIEFANSSLAVARAETASAADTVLAQTVVPGAASDTLIAQDTVDAGTTRVGALVSMQGPMGMPRQRWVDFIHPAGVEENASYFDSQDATAPGEIAEFVHENAPLVEAFNGSATYQVDVEDNLAASDSATTGSTFASATNEVASIVDTTDAEVEALTGVVAEVSTIVDIPIVDSIVRNASVGEVAFLTDVPGIAGELFDTVAEALATTDAFDISGAFVPGVNVDGMRTVFVEEEIRELEVTA